MSNRNIQKGFRWEALFKYSLPFIPFGLYLLTSIGLLSRKIMPVVFVITITVLLVWGLWKLWCGITNKDGREFANGVTPLAWAVLAFCQEGGFIDSNWFFYLLISSVGVSWLAEKLLLKIWEHKE